MGRVRSIEGIQVLLYDFVANIAFDDGGYVGQDGVVLEEDDFVRGYVEGHDECRWGYEAVGVETACRAFG